MPLSINAILRIADVQGVPGLKTKLKNLASPDALAQNLNLFSRQGRVLADFSKVLQGSEKDIAAFGNAFKKLLGSNNVNSRNFVQTFQDIGTAVKQLDSNGFQKKISDIRTSFLSLFTNPQAKRSAGKFIDQFIDGEVLKEVEKRSRRLAKAGEEAKRAQKVTSRDRSQTEDIVDRQVKASADERARQEAADLRQRAAQGSAKKLEAFKYYADREAQTVERLEREGREKLKRIREAQSRLEARDARIRAEKEAKAKEIQSRVASRIKGFQSGDKQEGKDLRERVNARLAQFKEEDERLKSEQQTKAREATRNLRDRINTRLSGFKNDDSTTARRNKIIEDSDKEDAKNTQKAQRFNAQLLGRADKAVSQEQTKIARETEKATGKLNAQAAALERNRLTSDKFIQASALAAKRFAAFLIPSTAIFGTIAAIRGATTDALEFEKVLTRVEQAADAPIENVQKLAKAVRDFSAIRGTSGLEVAKGLEIFTQAGIKAGTAEQVEKLTKLVDKLSLVPLAGTFGDIRQTSEGLLAVIGQFNIDIGQTGEVLDLVNQFAKDFAVTSEDIFEGIKRGGAAFKVAGGDLTEFISLFSILTETTRESADTLGTFFKSGAAQLLTPRSQELLKRVGVDTTSGDLVAQLKDLSKIFNSGQFSGLEKINISSQLVGNRQFNRLISLTDALANQDISNRVDTAKNNAPGSLADSAKLAADDINRSFTRVRETFNNTFREIIGDQRIKDLVSTFADLTSGIIKLAAAFKDLALPIGAIAFGALAGTVKKFAGEFFTLVKGGVSRSQIKNAAESAFPFAANGSPADQLLVLQQRKQREAELISATNSRRTPFSARRFGRQAFGALRNPGVATGVIGGIGLAASAFGGDSPVANAVGQGGLAASALSVLGPAASIVGGLVIGFRALSDSIDENNRAFAANTAARGNLNLSEVFALNTNFNPIRSNSLVARTNSFFNGATGSFANPNDPNAIARVALQARGENFLQRSIGSAFDAVTGRRKIGGGRNAFTASSGLGAGASIQAINDFARSDPTVRQSQDKVSRELLDSIIKSNPQASRQEIFREFRKQFGDKIREKVSNDFDSLKSKTPEEIANKAAIVENALIGLANQSLRNVDINKVYAEATKKLVKTIGDLTGPVDTTLTSFNDIAIRLVNTNKVLNQFQDVLDNVVTDRTAIRGTAFSNDPLRNLAGLQGESRNFLGQQDGKFISDAFTKSFSDAIKINNTLSSGNNRPILDKIFSSDAGIQKDGLDQSLVERFDTVVGSDGTIKDSIGRSEKALRSFLGVVDKIAKSAGQEDATKVLKEILDSRNLPETLLQIRGIDLNQINESLRRRNELLNREVQIYAEFAGAIRQADDEINNISNTILQLSNQNVSRNLEQSLFGIGLNDRSQLRDTVAANRGAAGQIGVGNGNIREGLLDRVVKASSRLNSLQGAASRNPFDDNIARERNIAATQFNDLLSELNRTITNVNGSLENYSQKNDILKTTIGILNDEFKKQVDESRQRGNTFLNTSGEDFAKQSGILNKFVGLAQQPGAANNGFTDVFQKFSEDQRQVLQQILSTLGNARVPGLNTTGNDLLDQLREAADRSTLTGFERNRPISQDEVRVEEQRRNSLREEQRRLQEQRREVRRTARLGGGPLEEERSQLGQIQERLKTIFKELSTPIEEAIRQNSVEQLGAGQQGITDQLNSAKQQQEEVFKLQKEAAQKAIDLQSVQRDLATQQRQFIVDQSQLLPQLVASIESLNDVVKRNQAADINTQLNTSIQSLGTTLTSNNKEIANLSEKISRLDNTAPVVNVLNPIYQSVNNIEKILQKFGGGSTANTLEVKPITVNVVLDAPDILRLAGPQLYENIIGKVAPAIANALGVVSPEAQSKFETSLGRTGR